MAEKNLNTRIINKHDTEVNWNKAVNFIPKQGEIIVYDADDTYVYERFKIGDGVTVVSSLPFAADSVSFVPNITSGNKVGTFEINGDLTDIYSPVQTTVSGNAGTATKLATGRNISLGTGVTSTATKFDGSANITIPVTGLKESYLNWGGKSISDGISPIGASLSAEHSANRLAYLNPNAIQAEYSNDAGSTWTDWSLSDENKTKFVTTENKINVGQELTVTTSHRTRLTITAQDGTTQYFYTRPKKLLLNVSTNGHGLSVIIETKTGKSNATWTTVGTYTLDGWSGWNDIPINFSTFGGSKTQTSNIWYMRLTFETTSVSSNYIKKKSYILGMRLFGDACWVPTSNMGNTGHLYSYDAFQNATFPANITATTFNGPLNGTASKATSDANGNNIIDTYVTKETYNELLAKVNALQSAVIALGGTI